MAKLDTNPRLADPDRAYRMLIEAHRGLSDEASAQLNARLVLILANQLGDIDMLAQAIAMARGSEARATDATVPGGEERGGS
jgi:hypothetical protein